MVRTCFPVVKKRKKSKMSKVNLMLLAFLVVVIAMQFIRPARNRSTEVQDADMITNLNTPVKVADILRRLCYDCHSNNTRYPWYADVQPIGWFLANHIKNGKEELNFSVFANYSKRRQLS